MAAVIPISEFEDYIQDLCQKEAMNTEQALDDILAKRASEIRNELKVKSPKDSGVYAKGWRIRTVTRRGRKVRIIYNSTKPWLTYILEYGRRGQRARPHIRRVLDEEIDKITDELISKI